MSNKNNLKDKIKKPNATQAFFNSYANVAIEEKNNDNKVNDSKDNIDDKIENKDEININNETYVKDVVNDNNVDVDNDDDNYLRSLASGTKVKKKKKKKVFTSFYMDPDLAVEVDNIASRGEKGDKSKLINKAIRSLLEAYGVIDKR